MTVKLLAGAILYDCKTMCLTETQLRPPSNRKRESCSSILEDTTALIRSVSLAIAELQLTRTGNIVPLRSDIIEIR